MSPCRLLEAPFGPEVYLEGLVEVGDLLEVVGQRVEVVVDRREYLRVWPERHRGAVLIGPAGAFHLPPGFAPPVFLEVGPAVPADLGPEVFREGVHDRGADAVEPAGDLVGPAAELPPRVQGGHDGLEGGDAG